MRRVRHALPALRLPAGDELLPSWHTFPSPGELELKLRAEGSGPTQGGGARGGRPGPGTAFGSGPNLEMAASEEGDR